jgi:hypothetical protein
MSVPFFSDFNKKSKDFFKRSEYDLGRQLNIRTSFDEHTVTAKLNAGDVPTGKVTANAKVPFGSVEMTEDLRSGLSVEFKVPNMYKGIDFSSKHRASDVEATFKYRGANGYWNTKVEGKYVPSSNGQRICSTKASVAVGDDRLVKVGGEIEFEDKGESGVFPTEPNVTLTNYQLGFLYEPASNAAISLIYSPDKNSNGLRYDFQLFKGCSDSCHLAARAKGAVDTKLTADPPVLSIGGGWRVSGNYLQGYANSVKEFGVQYKTKVGSNVSATLGVGRWRDGGEHKPEFVTTFGYKFVLE